jgi:hypothetical protein
VLKALSQMDKEAQLQLKDDVHAISKWTAQGIIYSSYGAFMPAQAAIVAQTVRANRDRLPNVTIGGSKGRASGGANAGQLLYGNEFGGERNANTTASQPFQMAVIDSQLEVQERAEAIKAGGFSHHL